jgi:hypothetical protein
MKSIITAFSVVTLGCVLPLSAQDQQTETTTDVTQNADGSVTKTETQTTTTFDPAARTKVVQYFDTYKANPHGLPPAWVSKVKIKDVPAGWRTTRIEPGAIIEEKERTFLIDAPADLVQVLPAPATGVHYYMAGSNVVAVDAKYKVVDSIQIPSIKLEMDD